MDSDTHELHTFRVLKERFPSLNVSVIDPQLSFRDNLQNVIKQLEMPSDPLMQHEITHMREAVDSQQLKIQKSLVNEYDILGNITNRSMKRKAVEESSWKQKTGKGMVMTLEPVEQQVIQNSCEKSDIIDENDSDIWLSISKGSIFHDWYHF